MAFSTDSDLTALLPDILSLGIASFTDEHARAQADIEREIRNKWWDKTGFAGELDPTLLTDSQWTRAASYLVLWKYALPQLTNWVDGDRFQNMIEFYRARFGEEMEQVFQDGVEYDADNDGTVTNAEKKSRHSGRLFR
jgi:hypothetical protein